METAIKSSQNGVQLVKAKLPSYQQLISMDEDKSKENDLQVLLNQEPPAQWVQINKHANNSRFLPVDKVEYLMTKIFVSWWLEILDYKMIANSICVRVRLFYENPITRLINHMDGVGAMPVQTDSGKGAIEFNHIKNSAVQMALPGAESYAFKDAAEKLGRIFGKDLNRKDVMSYENLLGRFEKETPEQIENKRLSNLINNAESKEDLAKLKKHIKPENEEIKNLFNEKLKSL